MPDAPPSNRVVWLLRRLGTVLLGLPLLYLVALLGSLFGGAAAFGLVWGGSALVDTSIAWQLALSAVLGAWAGLYCAVPGARFMLRLFPLRADGRPRWGVVGLATLATISVLLFVLWLRVRPSGASGHVAGPERFVVDLAAMLVELGVLLAVYLRSDARWPGQRVLYLRRFRGFSDRVVYRTLLAALPPGARLTALVPAHGGPRDLDPLTIAFAGMRWRRPVASLPRTFASPDDEWQSHVQRLMAEADCIVVDGSAGSAAMEAEYQLLEQQRLGARTLVLVDEQAEAAPPAIANAALLRYRRGLAPSLARGILWLALFVGYAVLSWRDPFNSPSFVLVIFLLVLPAIFQRSVRRESLRRLAAELERRVGRREAMPLPLLRSLAASLALALAVVLGLQLAARVLQPRPASDPQAWAALEAPMGRQSLPVGRQTIDVPVPPGFVDPKDLVTGLRQRLAAPRGRGQLLMMLVPVGSVLDAVVARPPADPVVMVLLLPPGAERSLIGLADFAEQFGDIDALTQGLGIGGGSAARAHARDDRSLEYTWEIAPGAVPGASQAQACAGAMVLAHGKPLVVTLCRPLHGGDDRRWVHELLSRWLAELVRRNSAEASAGFGGLGLSGMAHIVGTVAVSGVGTEVTLTIDEVVPGAAGWRAGLEPGDEIVAINGRALPAPDGDLRARFAVLPSGGRLRLDIRRNGRPDVVELVKR